MTEQLWRRAQNGETPEGYLVIFDGPERGALNCHTVEMVRLEASRPFPTVGVDPPVGLCRRRRRRAEGRET
jgi:hypothetical protein